MYLRFRLIAAAVALVSAPAFASNEAAANVALPVASEVAGEVVNAAARPANAISDVDLWERIRVGFQLDPLDSQLVLNHEDWYSRRPEYIKRFVDRGAKYLHHIVEEVEKRGMPMEVALLPVIESAFNPGAYSRSHAAGMWQFIPSTGKNFGLSQNWWADHRRDVIASTNAALNYLEKLHGMFGSWELAFAAYNCGEGCVGRAIAANQRKGLPTDYLSLNLPKETRNYVPKLIAVKNIILWPGSYGIQLDALNDEPYFTTVKAPAKIDVKLAAQLAEMPQDDFVALNPAFNKPVASTESGHFLLPIDKAETFRTNLEAYDRPLVSWTTYSAKRGESVDAVARRFGVSGGYLRAVNGKLRERKGRLAQSMLIMVPAQSGGLVKAALELQPAAQATASAINAPASYKVRSGDSLYVIAQKYDLDVDDLKTLNGISGSKLAIGQVLKLTGAAPLAPSKPVTDQPAERAANSKEKVYTIRAGDTLYAIAQRFGVAIDDLLRWNKLHPRSVIQPGHQVRIGT